MKIEQNLNTNTLFVGNNNTIFGNQNVHAIITRFLRVHYTQFPSVHKKKETTKFIIHSSCIYAVVQL